MRVSLSSITSKGNCILNWIHPLMLDFRGNGISGAHNRFTHYACPIMKAIKTNSGSSGTISNMVPSLQHLYTVSILLGRVEYVARQNKYDKAEIKDTSNASSVLPATFLSLSLKLHSILMSRRNGIDYGPWQTVSIIVERRAVPSLSKSLKLILPEIQAKALSFTCLIGFTINGKKQRKRSNKSMQQLSV